MSFCNTVDQHWETVVSVLATRIEQLEDDLRWKRQRIQQLQSQNDLLKAKLGETPTAAMLVNPLTNFDSDKDPFEDGDGDE